MADLSLAWKVLNERNCSWTCPLNYYLIHKETVSYLSVSSKEPNVQFWNEKPIWRIPLHLAIMRNEHLTLALHKKCPYSQLFSPYAGKFGPE